MSGDSAGRPDLLEDGMEGVEEEERICPYCSGTGEVAVGWGACYRCGGDGLLREIEDYEDLNEWERSMGW